MSDISIPTGTIKRTIGYGHTNDVKIFQFLLVRLKVLLHLFQLYQKRISIPTGTIKRTIINGTGFVKAKFQFLLVRLKA